jgi:hypothetical protein
MSASSHSLRCDPRQFWPLAREVQQGFNAKSHYPSREQHQAAQVSRSEHIRTNVVTLGYAPYRDRALSKKFENHVYALAIYFMHYNFVRIHQTTRVTPAMAAGVTDKRCSSSSIKPSSSCHSMARRPHG